MRRDYELVVIGAGSGGVRAARLAAAAGIRTALVEAGRVGGTCVLRGCVPKKLLVLGSHFAEDLADMEGFGWSIGGAEFDWPRLIAAKNAELARLEGVYSALLRDAGVTLIQGFGRLADPHSVEVVGARNLTARHILIATGSRPVLPDIPGIDMAITSDQALDLMQPPKRLAIIGGGYIAVEFAGIFNALGVEVHQFVRAEAPLRRFDGDLRAVLAEEMAKKGVDLRCETSVRSIEKCPGGTLLRLGGGEIVEVDLVLAATGRRPNSDGLGLAETGVAVTERGAVAVDAYSQSTVESVFAVGDVTDRLNLTPVALAEADALVDTLYRGRKRAVDHATVASAVFSQPPLATVGLSEEAARRRDGAIDVYLSRFKPLRNTLSGRDERSLVKLVVERATDRVLGVHMVGADAPEIIQGFAVALRCGATKAQFDATIGVHPTAAEELVTLRERRKE